nr:MAG TPA: hypothetical protein [Caudoviricetes sp.]
MPLLPKKGRCSLLCAYTQVCRMSERLQRYYIFFKRTNKKAVFLQFDCNTVS